MEADSSSARAPNPGDHPPPESSRSRDLAQALRQSEALWREMDRRKNHFLAMLGHELRNPLAAIHSGLRLLSSPKATPESKEHALAAALDQTAFMERVVNDLLELARVAEGRATLQREPITIQDVVRRALEICRPHSENKAIDIALSLPDAPLRIVADGVRLTQVVVNLLGNAIKYSGVSRRVELSAREQDGEIVLRVRDYGDGIAADLLPRVFDPFVQANPGVTSQAGLGMGLAVVKEVVRLHGGSVEALSRGQGQGSEFTVRLPVLEP